MILNINRYKFSLLIMHLILIYESKVYILGYIYLSLQNCKLNGAL